ncbi:MAG TPA: pitrilysin family protein [Vicinamibacterales bacterium]|nr:pitrilysin family protein [Vicinamibacterales bacterium]
MKPRPVVICLVLAMTFVVEARRQTSPAVPGAFDRAQYEIPHQKFVLPNGLTLLVHEDHSVPIVAVNLWYHVGSRNERPGKTGFAHLFEHFFFNGSQNYPHGFREAMDDLGANNRNGTTNGDRTNFFEDVPVPALERTLYLEADRMGFLAGHISKEMLERERGVVKNEKRQGENQPYGRVFGEMVPMIYPAGHPYSWSTIGSMDDLDAASLEDVTEWYRTYYGPNNCVLSIAGDVTAERALALVRKYFDGIPPGPPLRRAETWVPRFDRHLRDTMQDRVPQPRLYRVYRAPAWRDRELQHLDLVGNVLTGSRSGRLMRRLVYEKELATSVSAGVWAKELSGDFLVTVTVKPGVDPAVVERELDAVIGEFVEKGPTAEELQRAQSRTLADFVRGRERLGGFGGRSDILAESMTYDGRPEGYLDRLQTMATATPADVTRAAKAWLDTFHYTMVVTPFPSLSPGTTTVDRKVLPPLGDAPDVGFPAVQRAKLSNGMQILLLERHTTPLVNFALAVDAGFAADDPEKAGAASLALDLMDDGTTTRDTFRIADQLDALGARLSTGSSLDLSFVRLQALPKNLRPSLELMADVVLHPAFPQDMVDLGRQRRLAQIAQEKAQPVAAALRVVPALIYGDSHAYGKPLTGSGHERTVQALTRADLVAWHRGWFHPNRSTMIVTGDTTLAQVVPELERAFGAWQAGDPPKKDLAPVTQAHRGTVYVIDKPEAQQSVIVAAHVSERGGVAEDLAIETVMRNFGGMSTSRLNRNLRLDKHWSYGASGILPDARGQRPFIVVAPVQTDKTKESMIEVANEVRGIAGDRPIRAEEFASIMRTQTLGLPGRFETLGALESAAVYLVNSGVADDYFATYASRVRALTEQDLAAAAQKFIRPAEVIWIIVGDLQKIESGIRELNYGEVVRLDADGRRRTE